MSCRATVHGNCATILEEGYPLVMTNIAIENGPFCSLIYPLKMVIFNSYLSLPEGTLW